MSSGDDVEKPRTVVIADDHMIVRSALRQVLTGISGVEVVGEAENGVEAITLSKALQPRLLTLDSAMPMAKGMEVYGEVRRWAPDTRICLVTGITARGHLAEWVAAKVDGIVFKTCPMEEMHECFSLILEGGSHFSSAVLRSIEGLAPAAELTQRERQILHLLAEGSTNAEIAERLSISPKTVDNHRTKLMAKLEVHSMAQLLAFALKEGLLDQAAQL